MNCLYLTYNGLTDHVGQAQILPYLTELAKQGHRFTVVSFERRERYERYIVPTKEILDRCGIVLRHKFSYEGKLFFYRALEEYRLAIAADKEWKTQKFDFVHCRSYVPASVGLRLKRKYRARFVFDMRGFWVDQRIEGGRWNPHSYFYKQVIRKWREIENRSIAAADEIIVLTEAAKKIITSLRCYRGAPVTVIPCAVSYSDFTIRSTGREMRREIGFGENGTVLVYVGSLGSVYLLDEMIDLFLFQRERDSGTKLLFLGRHKEDEIIRSARTRGLNVGKDDIRCIEVERSRVPDYLAAADIGLCFITPTRSSAGVSPTKIGEYLACGLPVISNSGVGDVESILNDKDCGIALTRFDHDSYTDASNFIEKNRRADRQRIRAMSRDRLDLDMAVLSYDAVYRRLGCVSDRKR